MKALAVAALSLPLALGLGGCGQTAAKKGSAAGSSAGSAATSAKTVTFKDDAGREVEIPASVEKIVPSGHTANMVLLTIAPEKMVGLSHSLDENEQKYFGDKIAKDLPELGAIFGSKGDLNKEAVAATGAQLLIDTGEYKDGMEADLDELQKELGIPCIFIESSLDKWGDCYRKLGEVLGKEKRGNELADYCDKAYKEVQDVMANIPEDQRTTVLYLTGEDGTNVLAKGSFQANVVDMVANNVAVVDSPSGKGSGNESSLEQIAAWNPSAILFSTGSVYDKVANDAAWSSLQAVSSGNYYEVPDNPYNWLNMPPTVNQVLGMQWLPRLLYPTQFEGKSSIEDVVKDYYKTFYQYELSDSEYVDLVVNAVQK